GKGVCTPRLMQAVIRLAGSLNLPVLVDPARAASDRCYAGATLLKPNRHEAERASGISITTPSDAIEAARRIRERSNVSIVVVTLDRDGMVLVDDTQLQGLLIPSRAREVYDIT